MRFLFFCCQFLEAFGMGDVEERSECSSGCESGWTMYLDQTTEENHGSLMNQKVRDSKVDDDDEQEEDLSMVSDASSGPPHFHEDDDAFCYCHQHGIDNGCFCSASSPSPAELINKPSKRRRVGVQLQHQYLKVKQKAESSDVLDDTASSPIPGFSNKNIKKNTTKDLPIVGILEISCGFSATHFKEHSTFYSQFDYLKRNAGKPNSKGGKWSKEQLLMMD